ncbi:hypothetical protein COOONC_27784 [Cooperia oncophora]
MQPAMSRRVLRLLAKQLETLQAEAFGAVKSGVWMPQRTKQVMRRKALDQELCLLEKKLAKLQVALLES